MKNNENSYPEDGHNINTYCVIFLVIKNGRTLQKKSTTDFITMDFTQCTTDLNSDAMKDPAIKLIEHLNIENTITYLLSTFKIKPFCRSRV